VWREGWPQWRVAAQAFPELTRAAAGAALHTPASSPAPRSEASAAAAQPAAIETDDVEVAFDGAIRAPVGIDIGVNDLDEPPSRAPSPHHSSSAASQEAYAPGTLAPFDDEPEPNRAPSRTAVSYSSSSSLSTNAFLIAGLLITFIALVAVLIYLLTR
jgi:hypothetical protein